MKIGVRTESRGDTVHARVKTVPQQLRAAMKYAVTEACDELVKRAQDKCPVDTGHLKSRIERNVVAEGDKVTGRVGTVVVYAPYVHEGTGKQARQGNGKPDRKGQKAQPFLEDAINELRPTILQKLAEVISRCLKQS
ncbi:MAG: HK97 gp10 family phage protein [Clostridiales bacterium]|nr:HK97 gp10 family phage protein [Clostridiales bacterium]